MTNELDDLMSRDPLSLANDDEALRKVIHFMRQARANWDAGVKPSKKKDDGQATALVDLLKKQGAISKQKETRR